MHMYMAAPGRTWPHLIYLYQIFGTFTQIAIHKQLYIQTAMHTNSYIYKQPGTQTDIYIQTATQMALVKNGKVCHMFTAMRGL